MLGEGLHPRLRRPDLGREVLREEQDPQAPVRLPDVLKPQGRRERLRVGPHDARKHRARIARSSVQGDRPAELGRKRPLLADDERLGIDALEEPLRDRAGLASSLAPTRWRSRSARRREQAAASSRRTASRRPRAGRRSSARSGPRGSCARAARRCVRSPRRRARPRRPPAARRAAAARSETRPRARTGRRRRATVEWARVPRNQSRSAPGSYVNVPGIDDDGAAVDPELERERVRVRVRRQVRRRRRAAVEGEPDARRAEDGVAGVREDRRDPPRPAGRSSVRREVEPAVVEERGRSVGTGERGREAAHALDRACEPGTSAAARDLEQVTQDDEVVDGAALVVAAVGEHLDRELALEQLDTALEHLTSRRTRRRRARARARSGSRGCRARRPRRCARARPAAARGSRDSRGVSSSGDERQRRDPVAGSRRDRVRMPRVARRAADCCSIQVRQERAPRSAASPARAAASTSSPYCAWKPRSRSEPLRRAAAARTPASARARPDRRAAGTAAGCRRRAAGAAADGAPARAAAAAAPSAARAGAGDGLTRPPPRRRRRAPSLRPPEPAALAPSLAPARRGARASRRRRAAARAPRAAARRRPAGRGRR